MRVSDNMRFDAANRAIASAQAQQMAAMRQASTGARIAAPSDDPVAAAQAARVQASLDQTGAYRANIRTARGDISTAESSLETATTLMERVQEIALQGANGSLSESERSSLANEVSGLKDQLVSIANTKGSLGYLFAGTGTATGNPPFSASGAFSGNDLDRITEVGSGLLVSTNASGAKAFTTDGGRDIFHDLDTLTAALTANDSNAVAATVSGLDASHRQIVAARIDAGTKLARLDIADTAHQQTEVALSSQQHGLVDADPAAAYSRLIAAQQSLEAAVQVSRTTLATLSSGQTG